MKIRLSRLEWQSIYVCYNIHYFIRNCLSSKKGFIFQIKPWVSLLWNLDHDTTNLTSISNSYWNINNRKPHHFLRCSRYIVFILFAISQRQENKIFKYKTLNSYYFLSWKLRIRNKKTHFRYTYAHNGLNINTDIDIWSVSRVI